ncbi:MAG: TPM domain-containing protein [Hymenobacter sp.]
MLSQLRAPKTCRRAPSPPRLVNDLAGLMQPQEAAALEQKLVAYNDSTSSQIAVVTVPSAGWQRHCRLRPETVRKLGHRPQGQGQRHLGAGGR